MEKAHVREAFPIVFPRGAVAFARECLRTLDETTRGYKVLCPRAAVTLMDFLEQYQAENVANPWNSLQTVEGVGVMLPSGLPDI